MAYDDRYHTKLDNKYGHLTTIDIPAEVAAHEPWFNQTLTQVNDCVVRLGIIQGEYHWHAAAISARAVGEMSRWATCTTQRPTDE